MNLENLLKIPFRSLKNKHEFREYYTYKRDNVILFKKSNDYDGYWEESRYIDNYEDEGIALFSSNSRNYIYYEKDVIKKTSGFVLVIVLLITKNFTQMNVHIHYVVDLKLRRTHICWAHLPYLNSKKLQLFGLMTKKKCLMKELSIVLT